jgi:uncharacterized protein YozE (UPF0346 family)
MSFKTWLLEQQHRDDPIGDLARDAAQDKRFPRRNAKLRTVVRYLEEQEATPAALEALYRAWEEWAIHQIQTPGGWATVERCLR